MEGLHQLAKMFHQKSNRRQRQAYLCRIYKNVSTARSTPNKSPNKHDSNTQRAPAFPKHHRGRPRQSTSRIGPQNSTVRIRFTSAMQNFNVAYIPPDSVPSPRLARIHRRTVTPYPKVERPPRYQSFRFSRICVLISARYADAANYIAIAEANSVTQPITGQAQ